jgi:hypothetical protein
MLSSWSLRVRCGLFVRLAGGVGGVSKSHGCAWQVFQILEWVIMDMSPEVEDELPVAWIRSTIR